MVYLASDHGGFELKKKLKVWMAENNIAGEDMGAFNLDPKDDYPDFVIPAAIKVAADPEGVGIVIGRSGNGEAIAANKIPGIRAAVCLNEKMAKMAREHNNANVVSLGASYVDEDLAKRIIKTFLETPFSNEERHIRRIEKIKKAENLVN